MCPRPNDTSVPSNMTTGTQMCGDHPANSPTCTFIPIRNLQSVDLATALKSLQQTTSPLIRPHRPCRRFFR
nr:unnamed protein product [Callosobruchus chinensis]